MCKKSITLNSLEMLKGHVIGRAPTLFTGSGTSTVIPFNDVSKLVLVANLNIAPYLEYDEKMKLLIVQGSCSWHEANSFTRSKGRSVRSYPTEELATVLAGIATSATGERSFGNGTLRDDVEQIEYLGFDGKIHRLSSEKLLIDHPIFADNKRGKELLKVYQKRFENFLQLKNGPVPRLVKETDLMVGSEGQLGVITKVWLKTSKWEDSLHLFIRLNRWEESFEQHLEVVKSVNVFRDKIVACEFLDSNSLGFLPENERPAISRDIIILEIKSDCFDDIYDNVISKLKSVSENDVFEISSSRAHQIRMAVPRYVQEHNQKHGAFKSGTDVQVDIGHFEKLLHHYQKFAKAGITYLLFGHIGDRHLHFNFLNSNEQQLLCDELFNELYANCLMWNGSPFAEHGIGTLKQKYIKPFLEDVHLKMFEYLKENLDPHNQFFPSGIMNIKVNL